MKKLFLPLLAFFLTTSTLFSQEKPMKAKMSHKMAKSGISECCIMKGGKVYHYHNGKEVLISKDREWEGMKISPDGTCKMKDGKVINLTEGQCCDEAGMIHNDCSKLLKK